MISLLIFAYLNFKNLTFFGDSGIYILSFICALMVIDFYDTYKVNIEYVLIIIFLPMIDFLDYFSVRIYKGMILKVMKIIFIILLLNDLILKLQYLFISYLYIYLFY